MNGMNSAMNVCLLAVVSTAFLAGPGIARAVPPETPPTTVLLISSDTLAEAWKPFADWKTQNGKPTRIVTVSDIDKEYSGRDIQEKIRACCLDHIEHHNCRWVILGGDSDPDPAHFVPDRDTPHPAIGREHRGLPSDLYYISPTDWDANQDGVYGDWEHDREAISYTHAKACLGRIPLRTVSDVEAYTAKVIALESASARPGVGLMVYTCPEASAYPKLATSRKIVAESWTNGSVQKFFATETPWDREKPGDHDLSVANWLALINSGTVEKLHMHGHGLIQNWLLEGGERVTLEDVSKLNNRDAGLIMTTVSCFTGQFDSPTDPCIAEAMLRQPNGGAVVVVAPSREGRPIFHNPARDFPLMMREGKMDATTTTMTLFWKYALETDRTVGEAFARAKTDLAPDAKKTAGYHFVQCEVNLLGDPTLTVSGKHHPAPPE